MTETIPETAARRPRLRDTPLRDILRGRRTGRLDVERVVGDRELPPDVAALVREVVRRSRLWRLEKAEVAAELAAHFADGLEAGDSESQLTVAFGDPARAAALIRRAKKRSRPRLWRTLRYAMLGLAVLLVMYVAMVIYFVMGKPSPTFDYFAELNAVAASISERDRAWPLYRSALLDLPPLPDFHGTSRQPMPGETGWEEAEAFLAGREEALRTIREAAARPGLGYVTGFRIAEEDRVLWPDASRSDGANLMEGSLYAVLLPQLAEMRKIAKVLAMDAQRATAAADADTAVSDIVAMLGVARHSRETPRIISDLVSNAITARAIEIVGDMVALHPDVLSDEHLLELAHRLAASDDLMNVRFDGERLGYEDLVQRLYTDDGDGNGRLTAHGIRALSTLGAVTATDSGQYQAMLAAPLLLTAALSRREALDEYHRVMDMFEAEGKRPLWERDGSRAERMMKQWERDRLSRIRYFPVSVTVPALSKASMNAEMAIARRDAVHVAIALEIYRRRHGPWPASLDDLVPDLLPAVPPDRFDGRPLRYTLVQDQPVVYSVGADRDDDGGEPPRYAGGVANHDAASRWRSISRGGEGGGPTIARTPPSEDADGDWIIWPRPIEPIHR